jgi:TonB family protein
MEDIMRFNLLLLTLFYGFPLLAQTSGSGPLPQLMTFVAPAYPRLARDGRMTGTTVTRVTVGKDGNIIEAVTLSGHPFFARYVLAALKQWKFSASEKDHILDVICRFEFYGDGKCFNTPETIVSADLPTDVLVRTTEKCISVTTSDPTEHR